MVGRQPGAPLGARVNRDLGGSARSPPLVPPRRPRLINTSIAAPTRGADRIRTRGARERLAAACGAGAFPA